jgi:SAM-dependent methyltransferase
MHPVMDYDKTRIPETYRVGRQLPPETMQLWLDAIAEYLVPERNVETVILDLGCGTGRFSVPLAERFGAAVIGVEPSEKMRSEALASSAHPRVTYLSGSGEAIPCRSESVDAALLSMVLHHIRDLPAALRELRRVLKPGGLVFVRTDLKGLKDSVVFYRFFPAAMRIGAERSPLAKDVRRQFADAGFECLHSGMRLQVIDPSLKAHYERTRLRSVSTLAEIPDAEFAAGLKAMRAAAEAEDPPRPVTEKIGFLVFRSRIRARP